jgi:transketolase
MVAAEAAVRLAAEHQGIVYIRTSRPKTAVIYENDEKFQIGRAKVIRRTDQDRVTIVAGGVTLFEALAAHEQLKIEGLLVRIIDIFSIKPVDEQLLRSAAHETNNVIVTVEDHSVFGGLGDAVAGAVAPSGIRVHQLGIREMPRSGKPEELLAAYGIDKTAIVKTVRSVLSANGRD